MAWGYAILRNFAETQREAENKFGLTREEFIPMQRNAAKNNWQPKYLLEKLGEEQNLKSELRIPLRTSEFRSLSTPQTIQYLENFRTAIHNSPLEFIGDLKSLREQAEQAKSEKGPRLTTSLFRPTFLLGKSEGQRIVETADALIAEIDAIPN